MLQRCRKVQIRFTEDEINQIREKSKAYNGMSNYIRSAISEFSNIDAKTHLEAVNALGDYYRTYHNELYHIGANLNQVVKRANELAVAGLLSTPYLRHVVIPTVNSTLNELEILKSHLIKVTKQFSKIK